MPSGTFLAIQFYLELDMFKSYLKIGLRNLVRNKSYTLINITGLAIGIAVSFLILLYVVHEFTYDRHLENHQNIYRVAAKVEVQGNLFEVAQAMGPLAPALKAQFPEVVTAGRMYIEFPFLAFEDKVFYEDDVYFADQEILDIFSPVWIKGDRENALRAPFSLVLTAAMAEKYFGDTDPIGKVIKWNGRDDYTVTGIIKKLPANTHIQFNILASFATLEKQGVPGPPLDRWIGYNYKTYVVLQNDVSRSVLEAKFPALLQANTDEMAEKLGLKCELYLQPVTSIHLFSKLQGESGGGNITNLVIFAAIALFILLIACINFMNLATARSVGRAREVGVRKVLGADRSTLIRQFLGEAVLLSFLGLIAALFLIELFKPVFNQLIARGLEFDLIRNWPLTGGLLGLTLLVGLVSGSYPALFLSALQPVRTLKNSFRSGRGGRIFRNALVNFQFVISIGLICCTGVIYLQMNYVSNIDLGFDKEQLVVIPLQSRQIRAKHDVFKSQLKSLPGIINASGCSYYPSRGTSSTTAIFEGHEQENPTVVCISDVDYDYLATMQMDILAGRNFSREFSSDTTGLIVNETIVRQMQWKEPIGKTIALMETKAGKPYNKPYTVVGVIKDFHFASLHQKITPHALRLPGSISYIAARLRPDSVAATLDAIKTEWTALEPSRPFNYVFVDDQFDKLYRSEQRIGRIFVYFTALAIFIACLGLSGLASYTVEQKTKEIGIRKVLGATVSNVVLMLSRQFTRWVIFSSAVAWIISYLIMQRWLQSFAYRTGMNPWIFLGASAAALVLALLTVSFQSLKAATADPVYALRYE